MKHTHLLLPLLGEWYCLKALWGSWEGERLPTLYAISCPHQENEPVWKPHVRWSSQKVWVYLSNGSTSKQMQSKQQLPLIVFQETTEGAGLTRQTRQPVITTSQVLTLTGSVAKILCYKWLTGVVLALLPWASITPLSPKMLLVLQRHTGISMDNCCCCCTVFAPEMRVRNVCVDCLCVLLAQFSLSQHASPLSAQRQQE